jgi:hypothetical protein
VQEPKTRPRVQLGNHACLGGIDGAMAVVRMTDPFHNASCRTSSLQMRTTVLLVIARGKCLGHMQGAATTARDR